MTQKPRHAGKKRMQKSDGYEALTLRCPFRRKAATKNHMKEC